MDQAAGTADSLPRAETSHHLVAACARGDRQAFHRLFLAHKDRVYSIALHYTGDPAAAMDIAQDVFVKLFTALSGFRGQSSFETWLYRLVANCCHDRHRRHRCLLPLEAAARIPSPSNGAVVSAEHNQRARHVQASVASLPEELRMTVIFRYTEGLSYEEIAVILGCPAGTVASRLNRAHRELAKRLQQWKEQGA